MTGRAWRPPLVWAGVLVGLGLVTQVALPAHGHLGGRGVPISVDFQGAVQGLATALSAAGLVLLYRTSRVVNFAQVAIGAPGAVLAFEMIRFTGVPFVIDLVLALAAGAALGAVVELVLGRRFAKSSRLVFTVLLIAASTLMVSDLVPAMERAPFLPPEGARPVALVQAAGGLRSFLPFAGFSFHIGSFPLTFGFPEVISIELALAALAGLGCLMRFTRVGAALRSVGANAERAALLGIGTGAVATLTWVLAGGFSALALVIQGMTGYTGAAFTTTPVLLLPALAAAVLAKFRSIPVAAVAAVLIGTVSNALAFSLADAAPAVDGGLLVVLVAGLVLGRREIFRVEQAGEGSWKLTAELPPVPRELSGLAGVRGARYAGGAVLVGLLVLVPLVLNTGQVSLFQSILILAIVGMSLVVLTGWTGQVSLGQYGFVALGAVVAGGATARGGVPFWISIPLGVVVAGAAAVGLGFPALRARGLFLAVLTLAFGIAATDFLFDPGIFGWLVPPAISRPRLFGLGLDGETAFYYVCLVAFLAAAALVWNLRRTRVGRLMLAVRDNDAAARSVGVRALRAKLTGFAVSGALAGFAGALSAFQLRGVSSSAFTPQQSLIVFEWVVVGGVTSLGGAVLGVAAYSLLFYFLGSNMIVQYLAVFFVPLVIWVQPQGLMGMWAQLRDAVLRVVAQRRQLVVPSLFAGYDTRVLERRLVPLAPPLAGGGLNAPGARDRFSLRSAIHGRPGVHVDGAAGDVGALVAAASSADIEAVDGEVGQPWP